jgi:hypothetical protein
MDHGDQDSGGEFDGANEPEHSRPPDRWMFWISDAVPERGWATSALGPIKVLPNVGVRYRSEATA